MKIAYILFNGITWLDFIGVYDPVSRLKSRNYIPELDLDFCSYSEIVSDNFGFAIKPMNIRTPLQGYDALIIPGGFGTRELQTDPDFISWIQTGKEIPLKASVCTGSLILGAAGFLKGKKATTNFQEYENLKPYCREVVKERVVEDNGIITAGAVSSSLDLGLYLCEKWGGKSAAKAIRARMEYNVKVHPKEKH
jgi:transcriptional regulator GlxA family with amidase domain